MNEVINSADYSLISRERTEKLELLIHLIANSSQPLVICGPKGIGKTTLINILKERKKNTWHCCSLSAETDLTFDGILEQIANVTASDKTKQAQPFGGLSIPTNKLTLIIDDAGHLAPGLISGVIEYALDNPVLQLVFAITPDDLFIKTRTDRIIDDCYFIEIPPLTEKQCGDFLHYLATQSWGRLPMNNITEHLVATVYRETQGVPGRILNQLPKLSLVKNRDYALWVLVAAVAILVAIALGVQWLSTKGYL